MDEGSAGALRASTRAERASQLRSTGPAANNMPFRFSTKFTDHDTGLVYYGLRFYNPLKGRWLNRDPIGEAGGLNLYGMVGNDPVNRIDVLGLIEYEHGDTLGFLADCVCAVAQGAREGTGGAIMDQGAQAAVEAMEVSEEGGNLFEAASTGLSRATGISNAIEAVTGEGINMDDSGELTSEKLSAGERAMKALGAAMSAGSAGGAKCCAQAAKGIKKAWKELSGNAAKKGGEAVEQFYIQNGVRRSVASREGGVGEVPATIFRPGQEPETTTIPLDRLHSPKPEVKCDPRFERIKPPIHTPIEVEPLGLPGQLPTTPIPQVPLTGG